MKRRAGLQHVCRSLADKSNRANGNMRREAGALIGCAVVLLTAASLQAAPVTYEVSFSANMFQVGSGANPAPVDPVTGTFTFTLDPMVAVFNQTTGITMDSLDIALGSQISYT